MFDNGLIDELLKVDGGRYSTDSLNEAYSFCNILAKSHYENFPVASILAPKSKQRYVHSIYCFARLADDIADELKIDQKEKIKKLDLLIDCIDNNSETTNPIFLSLNNTLKECKIPKETLEKLIAAFKWDSEFKQAQNWDDTLRYCDHSANPIGEIVLRVFDEYNEKTIRSSDAICTGLQLANFWQDFSRDLPNDRFYIPINILEKYGLENKDLFDQVSRSDKKQDCLDEIITYTEKLFNTGSDLPKLIKNKRLKLELELTINSGKKILSKVKQKKLSIFVSRPSLSKFDFIILGFKSLVKIIF